MKKEIDDTIVKGTRNFLRLQKENKAIKNIIIRDKSMKKKKLSVEEYFNKIRPYLKDIRRNMSRCSSIFIDMQRLITNSRKIVIKTKNRHVLNIGM